MERSALQKFANLNGLGSALPPPPKSGAAVRPWNVSRVQLSGGLLQQYVMHDSVTPLENVYRKLPESGIFEATPSRPCVMEMGAFEVPQQMVFVLLDYRFDIYRFNGAAIGDFIPIEDRRLSTQIGWDIATAAGERQGNLRYELTPSVSSAALQAYSSNSNAGIIPGTSPGIASQDAFDRARAAQTQIAGGGSLSTLPQRHHREGLMPCPYAWVIRSKERLVVRCIAFGAVPIPIAFFEANVTGSLIPANAFAEIMNHAAPPMPPGGV